ncbi:ATP-binding protein, partial [Mesorhizobium sp. M8A.F.Ca.ET.142.01.1.1]|uniref:ATP-binding protein n=1 Tax=Mesorhizobium sp. M8A.F.Ca.ET.142.01.1.1 TaxID=2563958 RepID=UPI001FF069E3
SDSGRTLAEHMREEGFDPDAVRRGVPGIDAGRIATFIEVHIEQGPRLVAAGAPVGIVTGIAGGFRYVDAKCLGAYAHSGAEPRFARHDAVLVTNADLAHSILWNLLRNACQYTENGEVRITLHDTALIVADTGPGLPSSIDPRQFQRFVPSGVHSGEGL